MAIALVAHTGVQSTNGNTITTSAIDTSTANFLVAVTGSSDGTAPVSDSKTGSWTPRTIYDGSHSPMVRIWFATNPTVGAGHTFTVTASSKFPTLCIAAFSGVDTTAPYDGNENGAYTSAVTTAQAGSITPSLAGELVIAGLAWDSGFAASGINGGFTITDQFPLVGGLAYGGALAYLIQTSAAAANPTWTIASATTNIAADIAAFQAGAAATGLPPGLGPEVGMTLPVLTSAQSAMMR